MEAVPRLPMLSFDIKSSTESPSFGPKLKQYIRDFYNEDPDMYSNEIHTLEGIRAQAVCAVRNATGCQALKRYYCQLHFLQSRFPMAKDGAAAVSFTWQDTYTSLVCTLADIRFEMVCILYNIGALHSQLGASDSRVSPNGMKMCCTHFQCAAWAFQHLKDTYPQPAGVDLAPNVMLFMYQLTLAQAQECILEKSMMDNRKATIIAKVAVQVVDYYNLAMNVLEQSGSDECSVGDTVGSKLYKNWKRYIKFKTVYHSAISLLYHGQQAEEQQKMGERVAFYQAASDKLKEAMKLSKGMDEVEAVNEALAFTMDVIEGKRKGAKNENEFIYHEVVPDRDTLQEVKGASLVQGISFDVNDVEISGADIFARLVPMKAHEASSLYSEEKAKLRRKVGAMIDEKDDQLIRFMSSLQLDQLNSTWQQDEFPEELVDRCAALSAKPDAIPSLNEAMNKLADVSHDVECMLQDVKTMLELEEQREKEYQEVLGKRPPSIAATDLTREARKYQEAHSKASESNQTLHKAMMLHIPNLRNLSVPLADLQKLIPTVTIQNSPADDAIVKRLQLLVSKVDEMRQQRSMLANSLRTATSRDDITTQLVTRASDSLDTIFDQEMQKHQRIVATIEQNLTAQDNILKEITEAYPHFIAMKKETDEKLRGRRSMINSLIASYDAYEDLLAKSGKGLEFYRKLETNVTKLLQRVKGTCRVQDEEREQVLAKNYKTIPSASGAAVKPRLPVEPVTNKGGPKLKDYLQSMKMNAGQVPAAGYASASVPYYPPASYPRAVSPVPTAYHDQSTSGDSGSASQWVPSVRPAPVGQEGSEQTASACYVSNNDSRIKPITSTTPQHGYSYAGKMTNSQAYYNTTGGQYTSTNQNYPTVTTPSYNYSNQQYQSLPAATVHNAAGAGSVQSSHPQSTLPINQSYHNANQNQNGQGYNMSALPQSNVPYSSESSSAGYNTTSRVPGGQTYNASNAAQGNQTYNAAQGQMYNPVQSNQGYNSANPVAYSTYPATAGSAIGQSTVYPTSGQQYVTGAVGQNQTYTIGASGLNQGYTPGTAGTNQGYQAGAVGINQAYNTGTPGTNPAYKTGTSAMNQAYNTGTAGTVQAYTAGANTATQGAQSYSSYGQQATNKYPEGSYLESGGQYNYSTQQVAYPSQQPNTPQQKQYVNPQQGSATSSQNQSTYYPQSSTPQPANLGQYNAAQQATASQAPVPPQINSYAGHPGYSFNSMSGQYEYTSGYQAGGQSSLHSNNTQTSATWPQSYVPELQANSANSNISVPSAVVPQGNQPQNYVGQQTYSSARNNSTVSSQSSFDGQGQYNASAYNQGSYYTLPYGYQDGTGSTPMPPPSPQQTGHTGQQATYMHAGATNKSTSTNTSQSSLTSSLSVERVNDSSNVDLLAGLDFNVNVTPLLPQTVVEKTKQFDSPKKVNGVSGGAAINRPGTSAVEQKPIVASSIKNELTFTEAVTRVENKLDDLPPSLESQEDGKLSTKGKDPYPDPDALNQFVQEVEKYEKFVDGLTTKTLNGPTPLDMKWKELADFQEKDANKRSISVARCYPMKNRFPDILPYDGSRVELPSTKDDYINASYLKDLTPLSPPFIVTQAPLPSTYTDFWTMVWEQQVEVIVCLLSDAELQDQVYWPREKSQEVAAGRMKVTLQSSEVRPHWVERIVSLCLVETRATRVIVHLQFTVWPGSSFPPSPAPFLGFVSESLSFYNQQRGPSHPVVVHCLSGVGRSGLFCLIAAALCEIQAGRGLLELVQVAANMSTARKATLRDREHLKFAYQAMLYYAQDMLMKTATNIARSSHEKQSSQDSHDTSKPSQSSSSICSSVSSSGRSSPLGHSMTDLSRLGSRQEPSGGKSRKRFTRESFSVNQSSSALEIKPEIADDPLSQLDPLWQLK